MKGNAAESAAPFDHRAVVVRVRDRDASEPAEAVDDLDGGGIDEGDAVPQNVAAGHPQQQRALSDGEFGQRTDPDEPGLVLAIAVEMPARERVERRPTLPAGRNELAFVLTDRTGRRRLLRRCELAA